jgi:hypothetical protein
MPLNWNFPAIIGPENRMQVSFGYQVYSDLGRLPLSGGRARCVQPSDRGLVDGDHLAMAGRARRPRHGALAQYTSIEFGKRCREAGVRPSMGSVGDAYDNAMADSFFATLECELLDRHHFKTQAEARIASKSGALVDHFMLERPRTEQ